MIAHRINRSLFIDTGLWLMLMSEPSFLGASVKSRTGTIDFQLGGQLSPSMRLSSEGLVVGSASSTSSANLEVQGNSMISHHLNIGGAGGSSNLNIHGTFGLSPHSHQGNITLDQHSVYLANSSAGNLSLTLPSANLVQGRKIMVKKISTANEIYISGGGNIDHKEGVTLAANKMGYAHLISRGDGGWSLIGLSGNGVTAPMASENLLHWWKLDETSGTTAYDSGQLGYHGTLDNGITFSANSTSGISGNALAFEDDSVTSTRVTHSATNFSTTDPWTLCQWINWNNMIGQETI